MLVLSRKSGQRIKLGDAIRVTVIRVQGDQVRIGIEAPHDMLVLREELAPHEVGRREPGRSEPPRESGSSSSHELTLSLDSLDAGLLDSGASLELAVRLEPAA